MDPLSSPFHAHTLVVPSLAEEAAAMEEQGRDAQARDEELLPAAAAASSPPAWSRSAADVAEALLLAYADGDGGGSSSRSPSPSPAAGFNAIGATHSSLRSSQRAVGWEYSDVESDNDDDDDASSNEGHENDDSSPLQLQQVRMPAGEQAALEWPPGFWQREEQPQDSGLPRASAVAAISALSSSGQGLVSLGGHDGASSGSSGEEDSERSGSDTDSSDSQPPRRQHRENARHAAAAIFVAQQSAVQAEVDAWRQMRAAPVAGPQPDHSQQAASAGQNSGFRRPLLPQQYSSASASVAPPAPTQPQSTSSTSATLLPASFIQSASESRAARFAVAPLAEHVVHDLPDLVCSICSSLPWEPVQTSCEHVFCRACIDAFGASLSSSSALLCCPLDRRSLTASDVNPLRKASPLAWRILGRVRVRCVRFAQLGCAWEGEYSEAAAHVERHCAFALVCCPYCATPLQRRHLPQHEAECTQRPISCRFCRATLSMAQRDSHVEQSCPQAPIRCVGTDAKGWALAIDEATPMGVPPAGWTGEGCGAVMPRGHYADHIASAECPKVRLPCPLASHGCGAQLERWAVDAHLQDAAAEHVRLLGARLDEEVQRRSAAEAQLDALVSALADFARAEANSSLGIRGRPFNVLSAALRSIQQTRIRDVASRSTKLVAAASRGNAGASGSIAVSAAASSSGPLSPAQLAVRPAPLSLQRAGLWWRSSGAPHLAAGFRLDVRDCKGKWLVAEVVRRRAAAAAPASSVRGNASVEHVLVHYQGWSTRWDEWLELSSPDALAAAPGAVVTAAKDDERVAALGCYTGGAHNDKRNLYALGASVLVYHAAPLPRQWSRGVVTQVDGLQCSVRYEPTGSPASASNGSAGGALQCYQRWFHSQSDEIELDPSVSASAPPAAPADRPSSPFLLGGFSAL